MDTVVFQSAQATEYFKSKVVLVKVNAEVDTALAREMAVDAPAVAALVHFFSCAAIMSSAHCTAANVTFSEPLMRAPAA